MGRLISAEVGQEYDFVKKNWKKLEGNTAPALLRILPSEKGWVPVTWNSDVCTGLGIMLPSPHGKVSCIKANNPSALLIFKSKLYLNDDSSLFIYKIGEDGDIVLQRKHEGIGWSYFFAPGFNDEIILGGNPACPFNIINDDILLNDPCNIALRKGSLLEWYSIAKRGNYFYLGNYPDGKIKIYTGDSIVESEYPKHLAPVWKNRLSLNSYLESQSVVFSSGYLFVGMFPFGDLVAYDETNIGLGDSYRLFSYPLRRKNEPAPYYSSYLSAFPGLYSFRASSETAYSVDPQTHRDEGKYPYYMSQRVPSVTILNGKICASTGNFTSIAPPAEVIKKVGIVNMHEYGAVYCSLLPNQHLRQAFGKVFRAKIKIYQRGFTVSFSDYITNKLGGRRWSEWSPEEIIRFNGFVIKK